MALANYSDLRSSIADWLNRDDLTAVIKDFVALAETQMNRTIRHHKMHERANANIDSRFSALPSDWLETIRFNTTGTITNIVTASFKEIVDLRASNSDATGRPQRYGIVGSEVEVYPTPDGTYPTELLYYAKIPALSDSNTTNWLLTSSPDAYLYGSLLQAAPYLKDDERVATWAQLYGAAIETINAESEKIRNSGSLVLRVRSNI